MRDPPLPLTLPFFPHHPVSIIWLLYKIYKGFQPQRHYKGILDVATASVWVTDASTIDQLWRCGYFGKGNLSRSTLTWSKRIQRLFGWVSSNEDLTTEERTQQRRQERLEFKHQRGLIEMEAIDRIRIEEGKEKQNIIEDNRRITRRENYTRIEAKKTEKLEKSISELEHLQLHLEEAFFLSYSLGILDIDVSKYFSIKNSMELLLLFCSLSSIPKTENEIDVDNSFLISYVVYHHYRSLGWVVKKGLKFGVDWLLYKRGPIFSHSEFAVIVLPFYPDNRKKELSWHWLHCINRVISQVKKTIVLCYVQIPYETVFKDAIQTKRIDLILKKYKIREISVKRWQPSRNRN
ncbi:tRNA-intron endonuclease [Pneumocystis murina B123]|uniref:tRNA-splicing endonuclease subunit Sen2 n=1 Tax=Pneumocystis murina (strain B123) TaxID=1069680 RepID=M7NT87_PNEMU|nr:tRNA-intron endonuclease [Pneumocystis murina B123]EMR10281.1 tRNA-intron endonuclease [Pneumocystis murina B123]